ncbi:hypothetical protein ANME2D_00840 [Candidatus Methanoperedens nitroreducens]|uniref:Uncharacterized protein n=1 Tax=Candidatus Methanoperedens nitratireducens TaxID=1392998 RepID=A0A062V790_9EURY|nr:hypothetical protein [Candidatus Methanoperedens nitroreducens]KCZ72413.1 hypothetical protein ANME2D_00840 [Candidatus Methanoperedens nitroreducens]MDJ1423653.1 hypothetical protein [Candidatus Methanoperedens sp.]
MEKTIITGASVIFSLTGLYFVVRIWQKWKNTDIDVLKARVFLNKKFLEKNWKYVFLSGASLAAHQSIDFLLSINYITSTGWIDKLSGFLELMALVFLVILAYGWFRVIYPQK